MTDSSDDMEMYSGLIEDVDYPDLTETEERILKYCKAHIKRMWAAHIASIILDCDFKDVENILKEIQS